MYYTYHLVKFCDPRSFQYAAMVPEPPEYCLKANQVSL